MNFQKIKLRYVVIICACSGLLLTVDAKDKLVFAWLSDSKQSVSNSFIPEVTDGIKIEKTKTSVKFATIPGTIDELVHFKSPNISNLTWSAWLRIDAMNLTRTSYPRIIHTHGFYVSPRKDGATIPSLAGLTFGVYHKGGPIASWAVDNIMTLGKWVHVAITLPGGSEGVPVVYINGAPQTTTTLLIQPSPPVFRGGDGFIGNVGNGKAPIQGAISDMRIYDSIVSQQDIKKMATITPEGTPPEETKLTHTYEIPTVDISAETTRHTILAAGTKEVYQGHPTTVMLPEDETIFAIWSIGHGGPAGPAARSSDGGVSWTRIDHLFPKVFSEKHRNCPAIYRLVAPDGKARLMTFANSMKGGIVRTMSEDNGATWQEMPNLKVKRPGMPITGVIHLKNGSIAAFGQTSDTGKNENVPRREICQGVFMIISNDGGLTFGESRIIAMKDGKDLCEPFVLRSPDGSEICCLMRENKHKGNSMMCFSQDEGLTWSEPEDTPWGLSGDRHEGVQAPDGRWVIAFRDRAIASATYGHFVAWVGTYDDIRHARPGQYRIKLLHNYSRWDCGYPGMECLSDGTVLATTYIKYWNDERKHSVVMTRFKLNEIDQQL